MRKRLFGLGLASLFAGAILVGVMASNALATGFLEFCSPGAIDTCVGNCSGGVNNVCMGRICNSPVKVTKGCVSAAFAFCSPANCPGTCAGAPAIACLCQFPNQGC